MCRYIFCSSFLWMELWFVFIASFCDVYESTRELCSLLFHGSYNLNSIVNYFFSPLASSSASHRSLRSFSSLLWCKRKKKTHNFQVSFIEEIEEWAERKRAEIRYDLYCVPPILNWMFFFMSSVLCFALSAAYIYGIVHAVDITAPPEYLR